MAQNYQLSMKTGPTPGQIFILDKQEMTVGREAGNELVVSDADVSRKHARFILQANAYLVEDLGSTNGTFVNGERIAMPVLLNTGDTVQLGDAVELLYEAPGFDAQATLMAPQPEPQPVTIPEPMPDLVVEQPVRPAGPAFEAPVVVPPVYEPPVVEPPAYEPLAPAVQAPKKGGSKTGVIVAVGCVVLLCLCMIVAAVGYYLYNSGAFN